MDIQDQELVDIVVLVSLVIQVVELVDTLAFRGILDIVGFQVILVSQVTQGIQVYLDTVE